MGAAAAVLAVCHLAVGSWRTEGFALRPTRRSQTALSREAAEVQLASYRTVLFKDDPAALLMVHATRTVSGRETLTLSLNGKPDATSHDDLPTQLLLGHVPLFLAPQPRDVLVIGLASGVTAGAVLAHPVRRLDVVDVVAAMPEATRLFREWNRDPLGGDELRGGAGDLGGRTRRGSGRPGALAVVFRPKHHYPGGWAHGTVEANRAADRAPRGCAATRRRGHGSRLRGRGHRLNRGVNHGTGNS